MQRSLPIVCNQPLKIATLAAVRRTDYMSDLDADIKSSIPPQTGLPCWAGHRPHAIAVVTFVREGTSGRVKDKDRIAGLQVCGTSHLEQSTGQHLHSLPSTVFQTSSVHTCSASHTTNHLAHTGAFDLMFSRLKNVDSFGRPLNYGAAENLNVELIDWLIDWFIYSFIHSFIHSSIHRFIH